MSESSDKTNNDIDCEEVTDYKIDLIISKKLVHFSKLNKFKSDLKELSNSLNTFITFERKESEDKDNNEIDFTIRISGETRDKVIETEMKLNKLLSSMRKSMPFTHLITVPFNNEIMSQQFSQFKDLVLNQFKDCKGIDENLFQTPEKLHLTLCVLVLLNNNEILRAKQILNDSFEQIVKPLLNEKPLRVSVEGLDVMNSDPNRAHILYARINDPLNQFQAIADGIVGQFEGSGLMRSDDKFERNGVKLHITFMNSLFRQRIISKSLESKKFKRIKRIPFNANKIIDYYNCHKFSDFTIESIQLNDIKTKSENGFYGLIENIELPKE